MDKIELFCDGACRGNGNPQNLGGWGAYVKYKESEKRLAGTAKNTTNNIMELTACIAALNAFNVRTIPMVLTTDSEYVCKGMNEWSEKWKKNGWKNAKKKKIANYELWRELIDLVDQFDEVTFVHCYGHKENVGNIIADSLANEAMDAANGS